MLTRQEIDAANTVRDEILADVKRRTGLSFSEVNTGGGCMALEARLESGHWIAVTDDALASLTYRIHFESQTDEDGERISPLGTYVGVYENDPETDSWMCSEEGPLTCVYDDDAYAATIPDMIVAAISQTVGAKVAGAQAI